MSGNQFQNKKPLLVENSSFDLDIWGRHTYELGFDLSRLEEKGAHCLVFSQDSPIFCHSLRSGTDMTIMGAIVIEPPTQENKPIIFPLILGKGNIIFQVAEAEFINRYEATITVDEIHDALLRSNGNVSRLTTNVRETVE